MIVSTVAGDTLTSRSRLGRYYIRLKVSPGAREDAWDICRVAAYYGGVEVHDCCFAFPSEERWLTALEVLRFRFGPEYFEAVNSAETHHD
jgi:hypothetical protein